HHCFSATLRKDGHTSILVLFVGKTGQKRNQKNRCKPRCLPPVSRAYPAGTGARLDLFLQEHQILPGRKEKLFQCPRDCSPLLLSPYSASDPWVQPEP